ncbi:MAG: PfkB family carbohydrate kinase, partial [Verrucomicrobiota bacterium]
MKVVVIGSLNVDYIAAVDRLPAPGETVAATGLVRRFGGKGANQAVAAARQDAQVCMVGCVGADDEGRAYCQRLRAEGIDASGVVSTRKALTGTALIAVDRA